MLRVGGVREIPVDVRIPCATHRDLRAEVAAGRFREELYYRISALTITVPALRERGCERAFPRFRVGLALGLSPHDQGGEARFPGFLQAALRDRLRGNPASEAALPRQALGSWEKASTHGLPVPVPLRPCHEFMPTPRALTALTSIAAAIGAVSSLWGCQLLWPVDDYAAGGASPDASADGQGGSPCGVGLKLCSGACEKADPQHGCDETSCDPIDTSKDPEHCGACGHSCNGDTCTGSACAVTDIATSQPGPNQVAVDATHV